MKRHSGALAKPLAALSLALLLPLGALAAEEPATRAEPPAKNARTPAESADDTTAGKKEGTRCQPSASSRIRRDKARGCAEDASPTRSYSRQEIENTGQTDMGEALRRLDPRFH